MCSVMCPKDEARVQRSIASVMRKIEASIARTSPSLFEKEKEFEKSCIEKGLIYSPSNFIVLCK